MALEIKTRYDSDNKIFIKQYKGEVQINDVFASWEEIINSNNSQLMRQSG